MKLTMGIAEIIRYQAKNVWVVKLPSKLKFATKEFRYLKEALTYARENNSGK